MRELDFVEVIVEKNEYAKFGVHKGMQGTILDPRLIEGYRLVYFADDEGADTIGIPIKEADLKVIVDFREELIKERNNSVKVRIKVEKPEYAEEGVHKGMQGWIDYPKKDPRGRLHIAFDFDGNMTDIGYMFIAEEDLEILSEPKLDD